jgi:hypothetical protein
MIKNIDISGIHYEVIDKMEKYVQNSEKSKISSS